MRWATLAALLAVAGCGRSGALLEDGGAIPTPDLEMPVPVSPTPGPTPTPMPVLCDPADPELLACFAFDASAADGSSFAVAPVTANLSFAEGVEGSALSFSVWDGLRSATELCTEAGTCVD